MSVVCHTGGGRESACISGVMAAIGSRAHGLRRPIVERRQRPWLGGAGAGGAPASEWRAVASTGVTMTRVLGHEPQSGPNDCASMLAGHGLEVVPCRDRESLFDAMAVRRPDLVVYVLDDVLVDIGVLTLMRRIAPSLPMILLGGSAGLDVRRSIQELRPTYYGVFPLDPSELRDAVHGVIEHHGRALAS